MLTRIPDSCGLIGPKITILIGLNEAALISGANASGDIAVQL